jgi:hypothetical protein
LPEPTALVCGLATHLDREAVAARAILDASNACNRLRHDAASGDLPRAAWNATSRSSAARSRGGGVEGAVHSAS